MCECRSIYYCICKVMCECRSIYYCICKVMCERKYLYCCKEIVAEFPNDYFMKLVQKCLMLMCLALVQDSYGQLSLNNFGMSLFLLCLQP